MVMALSVKNLVSIVFLLHCYAVRGQDVPEPLPACVMKEYAYCARLVGDIKLDQACRQVGDSMHCVERLVKACGLSPNMSQGLCSEVPHDSYCDILSGMGHAPMSSPLVEPSLCIQYKTLYSCHEENCGAEPSHFRNKGRGHGSTDGTVCAKKAAIKCTTSMLQVTEVTKETCIDASTAKICFLNELDLCGGSQVAQIYADILLAGLVRHVKQCKEKAIGFTKDGSECAANPSDAYVPIGLVDSEGHASQTTSEKNCGDVHLATTKLGTFARDCNATDYQTAVLERLMEELGPMKQQCEKAGFKNPNNSAPGLIIGQLSQALVVMATGLVVLVTHRLC